MYNIYKLNNKKVCVRFLFERGKRYDEEFSKQETGKGNHNRNKC